MNETLVTVAGNVAGDLRSRVTASGVRVASFRLAATERRFHKELQAWRDGETVYYTVTCWRGMAENVCESVSKGQPMIVHGRLRVGTYEKDGAVRHSVEIEARSLGHDLTWGRSAFTKVRGSDTGERRLVEQLESELDDDEPFDQVTGELTANLAGQTEAGAAATTPASEDAA